MCADVDPEELHHPCCTGFAFGTQVVTANHCVPDATAELVSNRQWLATSNASQVGTVTARDAVRDIAWLTAVLDGTGLTQGDPVALGAQVRALTRSGAKAGTAYERSGIFWRTDTGTSFGDSGSAIVDEAGLAVGVLSECLTMTGKQCDPGTGIFAELP
jgi:S1-C subfamily serine protease